MDIPDRIATPIRHLVLTRSLEKKIPLEVTAKKSAALGNYFCIREIYCSIYMKVAAGVILCLLGLILIPLAASAADQSNDHVIITSGSGEVNAVPDRVDLVFSVQTEDTVVLTAQQQNARMMSDVTAALTAAGIDQKDVKTSGYTIYPVFDTSNSLFTKPKTYQVTNTLTVTLHDVGRAGEIIDLVVGKGVNQVSTIQFYLSDEQEQAYRADALRKAVANARSDAGIAASASGVNITGIKEINVAGNNPPNLYRYLPAAIDGAAAKSSYVTPIQPGEMKVSATVTITYLIV
jgi:uncharacterized protein YggE